MCGGQSAQGRLPPVESEMVAIEQEAVVGQHLCRSGVHAQQGLRGQPVQRGGGDEGRYRRPCRGGCYRIRPRVLGKVGLDHTEPVVGAERSAGQVEQQRVEIEGDHPGTGKCVEDAGAQRSRPAGKIDDHGLVAAGQSDDVGDGAKAGFTARDIGRLLFVPRPYEGVGIGEIALQRCGHEGFLRHQGPDQRDPVTSRDTPSRMPAGIRTRGSSSAGRLPGSMRSQWHVARLVIPSPLRVSPGFTPGSLLPAEVTGPHRLAG
ncbi:hypothetical protein BN1047_02162 [Mycolicibacterium neoaurum]|uniref:Uncharacterized protein n=1 Tax=Mycolicibacterium neoaurum TaxID=1795 RepID=A0AAV2WJ72_MYCNE|nr:hypothetical protein BN1047_02162 [Mycolicibacterium neoaurum]